MNTARNHPRPLRYRQAPASMPFNQHWATPIDHTLPRSRSWRHTLYSVAVGLLVVAALVGCGDDLESAQADAQALQDAQAHAIELQREARALAALTGRKQ